MADLRLPEEISNWISQRNWGDHHDEWHTVRRWDIYHHLAELAKNGDNRFTWAIEIVEYISQRGWHRAQIQEGENGNGIDFLGMHRAMLTLLKSAFPQNSPLFEGWATPPTDANDNNDPVPNGTPFNNDMRSAVERIEEKPETFVSEDEFGLFLETSMRPTSNNPFARSTDPSSGLHNYLHARWTDIDSEINLGDPTVNIYNTRFWKLHGWIDNCWSKFRQFHNLSDNEQSYVDTIERYKMMMDMRHRMHDIMAVTEHALEAIALSKPTGLNNAFIDDFGI